MTDPARRAFGRIIASIRQGGRRRDLSSRSASLLAAAVGWLCLALLLSPPIVQAQAPDAPEVVGVRFGINQDITRVVLDVDGPTRFATRITAAPPRLVVELEAVRWRVREHPQSHPVGLVKSVNYGHLANGRGRLVVDIDRPFRIVREERLPPSGDIRQHRVLVDLVALPPTTAASGPAAAVLREAEPASPSRAPQAGPPRPRPDATATDVQLAARQDPAIADDAVRHLPLPGLAPRSIAPSDLPAAGGSDSERPGARRPTPAADVAIDPDGGATGTVETAMAPVFQPPVVATPPPPQRRRVIALDPGHGGIDPGTVGINGVLEKEVTLDLARRLQALIDATGRYAVVMTRSDDVFVSLRDRMATARRSEAALFISIHADSISDAQFRGASVYTLSDQASDAEAARLATKENRADVIAGTDLSAHDEVVAGILIDLAQRVTNNKSIEFADVLTAELGDVTALVRNTRRFAGFVVLKSPDVPSVLLELGYLSNPTDAANLAKPEYRDRLARATLRAIDRHFAQVDAAL